VRKIAVFMKKYVFICFLGILSALLIGCKDDSVQCNYHSDTLDLTVMHEDWQFDEETQQFFYHFDVPEITAKVYDNGNWSIGREYNKGNKNAYQVALPMSSYKADTLSDKSVVYYTEHIDYRVGIGYVEIQLTNSDYFYAYDEKGKIIKPDNMDFRLQLIY
jgi:hypothetical protein